MQKRHLEKPHISDEPPYWLSFGAGGLAAGMVLPPVLLLFLIAGLSQPDVSHGLFSFVHARDFFSNCIASFLLWTVVALVSIHAHHRIYHTLHDLSIPVTKLAWFVFYGLAGALAIFALTLQLLIFVKLFCL